MVRSGNFPMPQQVLKHSWQTFAVSLFKPGGAVSAASHHPRSKPIRLIMKGTRKHPPCPVMR
jgi:hypothetical protein